MTKAPASRNSEDHNPTTDIRNPFKISFRINEAAIRGLANCIRDRLGEREAEKLTLRATARFSNGALSSGLPIDELLALDNIGNHRIVYIQLKSESSTSESDMRSIAIEFEDLSDGGSRSLYSAGLEIKSDDRDWAFVTAGEIEERILRTRRTTPQTWLTRDNLFIILGIFVILFVFLGKPFIEVTPPPKHPEREGMPRFEIPESLEPVSKRLARVFDRNPPSSISEAIIALVHAEEARTNEIDELLDAHRERIDSLQTGHDRAISQYKEELESWRDNRPWWSELHLFLGALIGAYLTVIGARRVCQALYPDYSFDWGGETQRLERVDRRRTYILVVIVSGIAVSIIGNFAFKVLNP